MDRLWARPGILLLVKACEEADLENVLLRLGRKREIEMFVRRAVIAKERFAKVPARMASELITV